MASLRWIRKATCYDSVTKAASPTTFMGKQSNNTRRASRLLWVLLIVASLHKVCAQSPNTPLILPSSVLYDNAGNLYFAETGNHLVRRLSFAGVLSVVAGTGTQGYAGDSGPATAALLDSPTALALDSAGDLFIADTHNRCIRRIDAATGIISTYATARSPVALAFNPQGALAYADAATHQVLLIDPGTRQGSAIAGSGTQGFSGDGALATRAALDTPSGIAFDTAGNLYLADAHNHRIRLVNSASGTISTKVGTGLPGFSGDGAAAAGARLDLPRGLTVDSNGNVYLTDSRNQRIRRVDAVTGLITTVAGDGNQAFTGDGLPATSASLNTPRAVAVSPAGLATLADAANARVRQLDSANSLQTIAGLGAISAARAISTTALTESTATTLAVAVSAPSGTPTGTVSLIDGTTQLASAVLAGGAASFNTSLLSTGSHTLTAAFSGSSVLLPSTSPAVLVTIGSASAADFTLTATGPATVTAVAGSVATFPFAVALTGAALDSPIDLAVAGAPSGATSSFSPAVLPPPGGPATFTLTIDTPASATLETMPKRKLTTVLVLAVLLLPFTFSRRRRACWVLGLFLLTGCGARVDTNNATGPPTVTYNITVSATATNAAGAALLHTAQVALIVN